MTAIETIETPRHPRKCTAHSKRSKELCEKWAMKGQRTCKYHGGNTPVALAKAKTMIELAELRVRGLSDDAVDALERLLRADSESVVLGAAKDLLDRGGLKAKDRIELDTNITVTRPW
tara:strand:+ start:112 stop:465 length:354 start_codon:yes stop_codon:yes gene_type:complete